MAKLVSLIVTGASPKNVTGTDVWAAARKTSAQVIVEVTTGPKNSAEEWKLIKWTGDGKPIQGKLNKFAVDRGTSRKVTVKVEYGETTRSIDIWIVSATIEILTDGQPRPKGAAPRDSGTRDGTDKIGAVTYETLTGNLINNNPDDFVSNIGASGKIVAVATLSPKGVSKVVKSGWTFRREVMSRIWTDGVKTEDAKTWTKSWVDDTSGPRYLRLTPDDQDKIYDIDEPDLRFGQVSVESYNNFRQWIEWETERCSEFAPWSWRARWRFQRDVTKQVEFNKLLPKSVDLPDKPVYAAGKR